MQASGMPRDGQYNNRPFSIDVHHLPNLTPSQSQDYDQFRYPGPARSMYFEDAAPPTYHPIKLYSPQHSEYLGPPLAMHPPSQAEQYQPQRPRYPMGTSYAPSTPPVMNDYRTPSGLPNDGARNRKQSNQSNQQHSRSAQLDEGIDSYIYQVRTALMLPLPFHHLSFPPIGSGSLQESA